LISLLFHKPYGVLSQFTPEAGSAWGCLADHIPVPDVYAAGRLDADSEGLLLLTSDGQLQRRLTDPAFGHWRRYWAQLEGAIETDLAALERLASGVVIQGRITLPARARALPADTIAAASLAERIPPIRQRRRIPTSWLELELREGRNRQVRRMTAAVGYPTLRLLRVAIDLMDGQAPLSLAGLAPGAWRPVTPSEQQRLERLLRAPRSGRGGRAGGGKSGRAGGGA
jgi:23S rRNA pseudouridine2457 synthase